MLDSDEAHGRGQLSPATRNDLYIQKLSEQSRRQRELAAQREASDIVRREKAWNSHVSGANKEGTKRTPTKPLRTRLSGGVPVQGVLGKAVGPRSVGFNKKVTSKKDVPRRESNRWDSDLLPVVTHDVIGQESLQPYSHLPDLPEEEEDDHLLPEPKFHVPQDSREPLFESGGTIFAEVDHSYDFSGVALDGQQTYPELSRPPSSLLPPTHRSPSETGSFLEHLCHDTLDSFHDHSSINESMQIPESLLDVVNELSLPPSTFVERYDPGDHGTSSFPVKETPQDLAEYILRMPEEFRDKFLRIINQRTVPPAEATASNLSSSSSSDSLDNLPPGTEFMRPVTGSTQGRRTGCPTSQCSAHPGLRQPLPGHAHDSSYSIGDPQFDSYVELASSTSEEIAETVFPSSRPQTRTSRISAKAPLVNCDSRESPSAMRGLETSNLQGILGSRSDLTHNSPSVRIAPTPPLSPSAFQPTPTPPSALLQTQPRSPPLSARVTRQLCIPILEIQSIHQASQDGIILLPRIYHNDAPVTYLAEYMSRNAGLWKTVLCSGQMALVDAVPTRTYPIYGYLGILVKPTDDGYRIAWEARKTRVAVNQPRRVIIKLYSLSVAKATRYTPPESKISFDAYHQLLTTLSHITTTVPSATLRRALLEVSSLLAFDPLFQKRCSVVLASFSGELTSSIPTLSILFSSKKQAQFCSDCYKTMTGSATLGATPGFDLVTIDILSNYEDPIYVGLSAIQAFDCEGNEITLPLSAIEGSGMVSSTTALNSPMPIPPHALQNLLATNCQKTRGQEMWVTSHKGFATPVSIRLRIPKHHAVGALRIWNYNESPATTLRGARRIIIRINDEKVADLELKRAPGEVSCIPSATLILLGTDSPDYLELLRLHDRYHSKAIPGTDSALSLSALMPSDQPLPKVKQQRRSYCDMGSITTATLTLLAASTYSPLSSQISLASVVIITAYNEVLIPTTIKVHGTNCKHKVFGLVPRPNATIELSPTPIEEKNGQCDRIYIAPDKPLWDCSSEASDIIRGSTDGVGITLTFRMAGTLMPNGSIFQPDMRVSRGEQDQVDVTVKNIILFNNSVTLSQSIRNVLILVNGKLWTPLPGLVLKPNLIPNIVATFYSGLRGLLQYSGTLIQIHKGADPTLPMAKPTVEPSIPMGIACATANLNLGQWLSLAVRRPEGAAVIHSQDYDLMAIQTVILKKQEIFSDLSAIALNTSQSRLPQNVYLKQELGAEQKVTYVVRAIPVGYTICIIIHTRHPTTTKGDCFTIGFGAVTVVAPTGSIHNFSTAGRGICSSVLSQQLCFELPVNSGTMNRLLVSDSTYPVEGLLEAKPWRVEYNLTTSSKEAQNTLATLGCTRVGSPLAILCLTASEPFELGHLLLKNEGCAEVTVSMDGRVLFTGHLQDTNDPQCINFTRQGSQGVPAQLINDVAGAGNEVILTP
ncbi:hypothetical protein GMRT_11836 [Giardia muris]|uniref:KATNIP domain-containing protein n=1 Tax=Giardia muris TaxID=5742 RepID=A0A4Z1STB7_GIAMU|nr:hypothetical protein GMRT_11836 [Giardia muris]|eukprot:TNJ28990.1 hypothetical protein GMRT_11836 [Giardia muris]